LSKKKVNNKKYSDDEFMRNTTKIFIGIFIALVTIGYFPLISAATSQWFPADGTVSEFSFSSFYTFLNGTKLESNDYDIYNGSNELRAIPSMNKLYFNELGPGLWTSLANNTELHLRYTYSDFTVNQWKRTPTIIWGENVSAVQRLNVYLYYDAAATNVRYFSGLADTVYKNNFFTTLNTTAIVDYFDSTKGVGWQVEPNGYRVMAIISDRIIAFHQSGWTNNTYIAGRDGRVQEFINCQMNSLFDFLATKGILTDGMRLTRLDSEASGIPSFPVILAAFGIIVSILVVKMTQKHKLF
jgi:hypothetical protein